MNNVNIDLECLRERLNDLIIKKADYTDILEASMLLDDAIAYHYSVPKIRFALNN